MDVQSIKINHFKFIGGDSHWIIIEKKSYHVDWKRKMNWELKIKWTRSTVQNVRFDVGPHLIVSAAVALDRRATIRRIFGTDVAVADFQRRRSQSSTESADTAVDATHFFDDARFLPVEWSHGDVVVLLFGRQIVRTGRNARFTAADDHSESSQIQLAVVSVETEQKADSHQNDS